MITAQFEASGQTPKEKQEGYYADLVFFDEDINIKKVIIEGKKLI